MADNTVTLSRTNRSKTAWLVNLQSANASGGVELKATPGAGANLYIEGIHIHSGAAYNALMTVTIKDASATLLGPYEMNSGANVFLDFQGDPVKIIANHALNLVSDSGEICVTVWGFTI